MEELLRSSIITGEKPAFTNSTTVCEPIKPAPPVTSTFIFRYFDKNTKIKNVLKILFGFKLNPYDIDQKNYIDEQGGYKSNGFAAR